MGRGGETGWKEGETGWTIRNRMHKREKQECKDGKTFKNQKV